MDRSTGYIGMSVYHHDRTHLGLSKDIPNHRYIQAGGDKNGKLNDLIFAKDK
jgi:hypothetical protein